MNGLSRLLRVLFGEVRWTPPPWLRRVARPVLAADDLRRRAPRRFWARAASVLLVAVAAAGLARWIATRPQPAYLEITTESPGPTALLPDAKPQPLRIRFSDAAAPLAQIDKPLTEGFRVTPPLIAGVWRWEGDRVLLFTPSEDWPVGQEYRFEFERDFLARQALVRSRRVEFHAPRLVGEVEASRFYEDPTDPRNKHALVTLRFTHPVDKASLEKRLALRMRLDPETGFDGPHARALGFTLSFDETGAKVFVHSDPIAIPERPGAVRVALASGVEALRGGVGTSEGLAAEVPVPSVESYFRVEAAALAVVTNDAHRMERIATLSFSAPVRGADLGASVSAWELPADRPAIGDRDVAHDYVWRDANEIVPEVLERARRLDPAWLPSEPEFAKEQSFRFEAAAGRTLYLRVEKGAKSFGDYALARPFAQILRVEPMPREIAILHEGSLLALAGDKKLSVLTRNLEAVEIELARLLPGTVSHLASQTSGRFQQPEWQTYDFDADDLSEVYRETRAVGGAAPGEPQYLAVDFQHFLAQGAPPRGLFQLRVSGWDPAKKQKLDAPVDRRIVLVTDLGFLVKDGLDGTHDVYVVSLAAGLPVAGAEVQLLGRNGLPVASRVTDAEGHATLPKTDGLEREKKPAVYVVQKEGDLAFLPFDRDDRRIDLSRFDVGGLEDEAALESLQAYLFSDRGVYRPGEEVTLGVIVKTLDWAPLPDGVPLEIVVVDPRGLEVRSETLAVPRAGFRDWRFRTLEASPTGVYQVQLHIVRDGERKGLLGQASVRVEEFLPDRMTIDAQLSAPPSAGWISPAALQARVSLRNLFGTPAVGHGVKGSLRLTPAIPSFPRWEGWTFVDPLRANQSYDETLDDATTDDAGVAEFALGLERFARATYRLRFLAQGFESEGGRSVSIDASAIVSPLPYLVAWKADGDLAFVKRESARHVEIVAIGPALDAIETKDVTAERIEIRYVSVLARQESGVLAYQSVQKEISRGSEKLTLGAKPLKLALSTDSPGRFVLVLRDGEGLELNRVTYDVVGEGNVAGRVERNAELKLRLAKSDVAPGEEIELAVQAPYAGAGLVTIERDRVYAAHWFRSDGNASVQRIRVPESLEGNGYVVVSFVRDLGSREIFLSPLSSGAAPFSVSRSRRTQPVRLDVPALVKPGETLRIGWDVAAPTKLAVFAVDEGILQVARWRTPDPLSHFFRKRALAVKTAQILDLLLPEYEIVRALSAPGGDEDALLAGNLNPFKRKGQKPVAFWSGVLDVPPGPGATQYVVPDSFNGTLRVLAVAANESAIGVAEAKVIARGPFVLQPTVPYFAAPGDELEATTLVANALPGSGAKAPVTVSLETSPELEIVGGAEQSVAIDEGRDATVRWRVRVKDAPGAARFVFRARAKEHVASSTLEMSVRPATPPRTTVTARVSRGGGSAEIALDRALHPALRSVVALAATSPLGLVPGLVRFLDAYPYGCSEQVVSAAFPAVLLGDSPDLGLTQERSRTLFDRAIAMLAARQNAEGAFGAWEADGTASDFVTAYATHFLLEARARGQAVPGSMLRRAMAYLETIAADASGDLTTLRARSYALYLVTRGGAVKTAEARALRDALLASDRERARGDVGALLLAAVFQQLHLDDEAQRLASGYAPARDVPDDFPNYHDAGVDRGLGLYLLAKHFPERARALPGDATQPIADAIAGGRYHTLSSALAVLALDAWSQNVPPALAAGVRIDALSSKREATALPTTGSLVLQALVPQGATGVRFTAPGGVALFEQVVQSGFDADPPREALAQGLEVVRELRGDDGKPVTQASVTSSLDVVLLVRSVDGAERNVALLDLLPGGFEVDLSSDALAERRSREAGEDAWSPEYVDVREDRVVLYGYVGGEAQRFVYRIKPTNRGRYRVPPVQIEGMYDRAALGRGLGGEITVGD